MQPSYLFVSVSVMLLIGGGGGGGTTNNPAPVMPVWHNPYNFSPEIISQTDTPGTMLSTNTTNNCNAIRIIDSNSPCSIFAPTAQQSISGINLSIDASSTSNDLVVADSSMLKLKYIQPLNWLGWEIANSSIDMNGNRISNGNLAFTTPPQDVRQAWATGFSGQGVNALVIDTFNLQPVNVTPKTHGYRVMATLKSIAPNANLFSWRKSILFPETPKVVKTNITMLPNTQIDVINMSFAVGLNKTTEATIDEFFSIFNGPNEYFTNSDEAVLVTAAGNDNLDSYSNNQSRLHQTILSESSTQPRALFVGPIDSNTGLLHTHSNHAGSNLTMQEQFLVEYDLGNFSENTYAFKSDGSDIFDLDGGRINNGTSFAAPTVAGKVALLRSKFPNLTGANTA